MKTPQLTAVGCSIYGGLFTVGVKAAGFRVLAHLEQDKYGVDTASANHPELTFYIGTDAWPEKFNGLDLIFCNPPCAVWSPVGGNSISNIGSSFKHWRDDPRLQHAYDALSLVARYQPKIWVWESVPQALTRGRSMIQEMVATGREHGYATSVLHFDATHLGVPQRRPRVFVVLHRVRFEPEPVDHDTLLTVRDAWVKLPKTNQVFEATQSNYLRLLQHAQPGVALRRAFDLTFGDEGGLNARGQMVGRPAISEKRLRFDGPGIPMMAKAWHPKLPRRITVGEALRLCQLPDDWQFGPSSRNPTSRKQLLQRAVMPKVGEWVARAARRAIERNESVDPTDAALIFDLRTREGHIYELGGTDVKSKPNIATKEVTDKRSKSGVKPPITAKAAQTAASAIKAAVTSKQRATQLTPRPDLIEAAKRVCQSTVGSGARIRQLLEIGKLNDDQIVALIHKEFVNRKTTQADIAWNRGKLRKAGIKLGAKSNDNTTRAGQGVQRKVSSAGAKRAAGAQRG